MLLNNMETFYSLDRRDRSTGHAKPKATYARYPPFWSTEGRHLPHMGGSKGRRASGASASAVVAANSPHRLEQHEAAGGWPSRVKVLASSTLGAASREGGGRTITLTEEDFRKSGFKARETVVVLAGPHRLIAGRLSPLPSAALRPGGVGLASASARTLGCEDGARVRVRRLVDTSVTVLVASAVDLVLEAGSLGGRSALQASPHAYLEGFTAGRRALLHRAVGFCAHGVHAREGDQLLVSFEGVPHSFRVARLRPPRRRYPATTTVAAQGTPFVAGGGAVERREEGADGDSLVAPLKALSILEVPAVAVVGSSSPSVLPTVESSEKIPPSSTPPHLSEGDCITALHSQGGNGTAKGASSAAETSDREKVARSAAAASAAAAASIIGNAQDTSRPVRARLEAFYREHNPEKLGGIDGILTKYLGHEGELFAKLEKKYGTSSSLRTATAGGNAGRDIRRGESETLGVAPASPFSKQPSTPADRKAGAPPRTPSAECQRIGGTPGGGSDEAGIRGWGSGESFWLINPDTAIEISSADAPPASISAASEENIPKNLAVTGDSASFRRSQEGAQGDGEAWGSVGGLSSQIQQLREAIELPLRSPEVLRRYGMRPPRGVLLHGPPGTGKTTLARAAAKACGCHVIVVNGSEVMSRFVGESEGALRQTFAEASQNAPCLVVFDEVDTLCPRRDQAGSEAQRRVVSTMLALLDGIDAQEQVVVIACTNRPQALDPALRRPSRLDSEVEVGVPDAAGRAEILRVLLRGVPHAMGAAVASTGGGGHEGLGEGAREIAARTHGFVGADLQLLVKEAALQALRRTRGGWGGLSGGGGDDDEAGERRGSKDGSVAARIEGPSGVGLEGLPTLTPADFLAALPLVSPSGLREVAVEVPSVKWGDIGGMEGVKQSLREVVEWPLRHPEAFQRMGMSPPRGVLLYGPPGCSKTLMARALATESGMNFLAVKGPELLSKWLGESERAMQALFKRARAAAPTIIFFDEVDALACKRGGGGEGGAGATERVLTQLLTELDGIQPVKRLVVVAATNRPDVIDPALLRPGRLDRLVYVPPPDMPSRREILRLSLAKVPCSADVDRETLARRTEGFSGAEVVALCREASICALDEDRTATQVRQVHLVEALGQMTPQITPSVLASYASFQRGVV